MAKTKATLLQTDQCPVIYNRKYSKSNQVLFYEKGHIRQHTYSYIFLYRAMNCNFLLWLDVLILRQCSRSLIVACDE